MNNCQKIHWLFNRSKIYRFPFDKESIPKNGIYILFENGEKAHGVRRIVRVGTHTGDNQLPSRLLQHFLVENKDRSIFRKNIGRAILNKASDAFLSQWEWDLTERKSKELYKDKLDFNKLQETEKKVSSYIQQNFSFVAFPVESQEARLLLESKIISTVSLCPDCKPSLNWLGLNSPKEKICSSGLWLVNELFKVPLDEEDMADLRNIVSQK